jgi:membrane-associated phospholipid phosphatase
MDWLPALVVGFGLAIALWSFDGPISDRARAVALAGDLRREMEALAQYGQGAWIALVAVAVWLLDPSRRRRLIDVAAALVLVGVVCVATKILLGRPRPLLVDPGVILGPWGMYPVPSGEAGSGTISLAHAWEMNSRVQYLLGSMPSRHTAFAAAMSAWLWTMYPVLRVPAIVLMTLVGTMRVLVGAHYPSDVFVGGTIGLTITTLAMRRFWGTRALDWFWKRFVNKNAEAALPRVMAAELSNQSAARAASKPSREA